VPAVAVGREDHALLIEVAAALREAQRHTAGQGHVALVPFQRATGGLHRHQRGGAGGLQRHAGAAQVQLVGHARAEEVLVVAEHELIAAHRGRQRRVAQDLREQVAVHARARVHAHGRLDGARRVTGVLQRLPGALQEDALLRVDHLRLARRQAEEGGVEMLRFLQHGAALHVAGLGAQRRVNAGLAQVLVAEVLQRLHALADVAPEGV
jgi:hypothetical protein